MGPSQPARVAFVVKGYPRLSESFIAQEIAALERRGLDILIVSLRRPTDARRIPCTRRSVRACFTFRSICIARRFESCARGGGCDAGRRIARP
jgi:hypothetical protein